MSSLRFNLIFNQTSFKLLICIFELMIELITNYRSHIRLSVAMVFLLHHGSLSIHQTDCSTSQLHAWQLKPRTRFELALRWKWTRLQGKSRSLWLCFQWRLVPSRTETHELLATQTSEWHEVQDTPRIAINRTIMLFTI